MFQQTIIPSTNALTEANQSSHMPDTANALIPFSFPRFSEKNHDTHAIELHRIKVVTIIFERQFCRIQINCFSFFLESNQFAVVVEFTCQVGIGHFFHLPFFLCFGGSVAKQSIRAEGSI